MLNDDDFTIFAATFDGQEGKMMLVFEESKSISFVNGFSISFHFAAAKRCPWVEWLEWGLNMKTSRLVQQLFLSLSTPPTHLSFVANHKALKNYGWKQEFLES